MALEVLLDRMVFHRRRAMIDSKYDGSFEEEKNCGSAEGVPKRNCCGDYRE